MLRYLTAGESHGQALVVIIEGLPAGLSITVEEIQAEMARRRLGYGRGPRQKFEQDELTLLGKVAALAGVSYRQAQHEASRLGIFAGDSRLWSETHHVRRLLTQYGIRPASTEVLFTSWEALPDRALLAIKWYRERDRAFWHWVVFWRGPNGPVVFDSKRTLRRHVRTDFGRMKPKWFISVSQI